MRRQTTNKLSSNRIEAVFSIFFAYIFVLYVFCFFISIDNFAAISYYSERILLYNTILFVRLYAGERAGVSIFVKEIFCSIEPTNGRIPLNAQRSEILLRVRDR